MERRGEEKERRRKGEEKEGGEREKLRIFLLPPGGEREKLPRQHCIALIRKHTVRPGLPILGGQGSEHGFAHLSIVCDMLAQRSCASARVACFWVVKNVTFIIV